MQQSLIFIQSGILPDRSNKIAKKYRMSLQENKFNRVSWEKRIVCYLV
jgi:hypothetical protein